MGEIADLMINGDICEGCGVELGGEGDGYPRRCSGCAREYKSEPVVEQPKKGGRPMPKVRCPLCAKPCSARGIADHLIQKHGYDK